MHSHWLRKGVTTMNHYAELELTNRLIAQQQQQLQRCDGPARYRIVDERGAPVLGGGDYQNRRLGLTLQEVLMRLCEQCDLELATIANDLLQQLNRLIEVE